MQTYNHEDTEPEPVLLHAIKESQTQEMFQEIFLEDFEYQYLKTRHSRKEEQSDGIRQLFR